MHISYILIKPSNRTNHMNLNLLLLLSIVAASPITDFQIGSGNDGQNIAEPDLDAYSGVASLDIAQTPPLTPLSGQSAAPSTKENICCTNSKDTDKPTCEKRKFFRWWDSRWLGRMVKDL